MRSRTYVTLLSLLVGCGCPNAKHRPTTPENAARATDPASVPPPDVIAADVPLMPHAVTSFGAVAQGNALYALGGYAGVPHAYSREGQSGALWRYPLASGEAQASASPVGWTELPALEPAQGMPLVVLRDGLVSVGGMRALNTRDQPEHIVSLSEARSFDLASQHWQSLPPLPEARSSHALVALGDRLYVVGGWTLSGARKDGKFADTMFVYDAARGAWQSMPQPFRLRALAAAVLDGKLVVLGGMNADAKTSQEVHVFDPATQAWSRGPDLPGDGFGIAATSNGDSLFASARDGVLWALDDVSGTWRNAKKLAFPRFFHQLVMPDATHVVALGGISGMHFGARTRPVEILDLTKNGPEVVSFTLENPLGGRNRQGVFAEGDSLYVFGGNRSLNQHDFTPKDFAADAARLDLGGMFWERLPDFPRARQSMQTLVPESAQEGQALAIGGFGFDEPAVGGQEARAQSDAFAFDFEHGRWQASPYALDKPRTQFGLAEQGGALWIFGGLNFDPAKGEQAQFDHPRGVLRAEANHAFEPTGIELPHPRRAFAGAQLDGKYYLIGGMAEGFAPVTSCEVFDFERKTFGEIPCPTPRISAQLVALDGKLYLAGGSSPGEGGLVENPSLEVYDPTANSWSTLLESLPIPPRNLTMVEVGGRLVLYSAHNPEGVVKLSVIAP
ncbi:MAG: kelch repeat-containing protein [Myxococcales bacterium]